MESLSKLCSEYIRKDLKTGLGYDLLRCVSLLSQLEQDTIIVSINDRHIFVMCISTNRIIYIDWHISSALIVRVESIYYNNDRGFAQYRLRYYDTGQLAEKGYYNRNGKHTGLWRHWRLNGNQWIEVNYTDGVRTGHWRERYSNGQLWEEGDYVNELPDGYWRYWFANGTLQKEGYYTNGVQSGHWKYWNENGQLKREEDFAYGIVIKYTVYI